MLVIGLIGIIAWFSYSDDHCTCQVFPSTLSIRIKLNIFWVGYNSKRPDTESLTKALGLSGLSKRYSSPLILYCTCHIFPFLVSSLINVHRLLVGNNLNGGSVTSCFSFCSGECTLLLVQLVIPNSMIDATNGIIRFILFLSPRSPLS